MKILPIIICVLMIVTPNGAWAAEDRLLSLELNTMQPIENGCRISFVVVNGMGAELEATSFEIVIFNAQSIVEEMLILEFGRLPAGKTKVVQFDLAGKSCDDISRLLINEVAECTGSNFTVQTCLDALTTLTKVQVIFGL